MRDVDAYNQITQSIVGRSAARLSEYRLDMGFSSRECAIAQQLKLLFHLFFSVDAESKMHLTRTIRTHKALWWLS